MATTDIPVSELIINKLTKAQYDNIQNPSDTELYLVPDEVDTAPTSGSSNYVTSGGVYTALTSKADKSAAIGSLSLSLDSTNYRITLSGTKVDGTSFTVSDVIDLPLESVVVSGSYDSQTKKVILTLQDGSTIDFSVADLVAGLQEEITSTNKLSADLIADGTTNKTVTGTDKTNWNGKYTKPGTGIPATDLDTAVQSSLSKADTALQSFTETDPVFSASVAADITSNDIDYWDNKQEKLRATVGYMYRANVSGSGSLSIQGNSGQFPRLNEAGTYIVKTRMSSATSSYTLSVTYGDVSYSLTSENGVIEDERELTLPAGATWAGSVTPVAASTVCEVAVIATGSVTELAPVATSGSYNDLANKPSIPAAQIQSDWNQTTTTAKDFIKNKPDLSIYAETSNLANVATSGSYNDLTDTPTIPDAQIQADWNQTTTTAKDYIKNKPNITDDNGTLKLGPNTWAKNVTIYTNFDAGNINISSGNNLNLFADDGAIHLSTGGSSIYLDNYTSYKNAEIANKDDIPTVPTNVSAFTNDAGYLTSYTETDPTVPAWAKASTKPTYTASEVGALPDTTVIPNDSNLVHKTGVESINGEKTFIQPITGDIQIRNSGIWGKTQDSHTFEWIFNPGSNDDYTLQQALDAKANTSSLATVATSGSYNDLSNKPTIPAAQVNSDWNATSGVAQILNKPTIPSTYAASATAGGAALKTGSIPFGVVDSTSTATVFTATVPGITELTDGTCVLLKNGVVTSTTNFTININGLGAHPAFNNMTAASAETSIFNINYTMLFVYDSTRVVGNYTGAWCCYRGYDANTNTIGYQIRSNNASLPCSDRARYYKIYFTSADGTMWVPSSSNWVNDATASKVVNQRPINPFGPIVYTSANTNYTAGTLLAAASAWQQYTLTLGHSFNWTGAALTLTTSKPVYVKCAPQSDGSAIIDSTTPIVQALPSTEDGKIYIFLGIAYSATNIELRLEHPVFYYKDSAIRLWTNAAASSSDTAITNSEIDDIWDEAMINIITVTMTGGDTLLFDSGTKADGTSLNGFSLRTGESVQIVSAPITVKLQNADTASGRWYFNDVEGNSYQYTLANGDTYNAAERTPMSSDIITLTPLADMTFWADID